MAFNKLRFTSFVYLSLTWVLIVSISIAPWGIRNLNSGGNKPFVSVYNSNFIPKNTNGYLRWVHSWMVTEHEQAKNVFPIWEPPMNLTIEKNQLNPFIKNSKILKLKEKYKNVTQFSSLDNDLFLNLSKQREKNMGIVGSLLLYISRTLSLLLNPLNSWGWPMEIMDNLSKEYSNLRENINLLIKPNIFIASSLKLLLFFYRLIFFKIFFKGFISTLIKRKLSILKTNSLTNILGLSSILFLVGVLYLIVIRFPNIEHRYISIIIPWIEVSSLLYIFKFNKELDYINKQN